MTKSQHLLLLIAILAFSCKSIATIDFSSYKWIELKNHPHYIFRADSVTAIVDTELAPGSILLAGNNSGDFCEVYVFYNSSRIQKGKKYYLNKPDYDIIGTYSTDTFLEKIIYAPIERERTYIPGPNSGCYYVNKNGNRIYVDQTICFPSEIGRSKKQRSKPKISNKQYATGDIHVKGHYRRTKSGKLIYVRPHTRNKN